MWLGEFGLAMKRVWRIDLANHPPLRCRSDRPIWRRFSGSCCTDVLPQPCSILYPLPPAPFPLDLSGSGEHSCACPFGPPRIALSWRHQRSRSGPNGQPPESSHLGELAHHAKTVCGISDVGIVAETRRGTRGFGLAVVGAAAQYPQPARPRSPCRAVLRGTAVIVVPAVFHPLRGVAGSIVEAERIGFV